MDDTSPEIAKKMREMFLKKTPLERLQMGCSMYDTSRYVVSCAILRENPNITNGEFRKEIFLRFYGNDFDTEERNKIIEHLKNTPNGPSAVLLQEY